MTDFASVLRQSLKQRGATTPEERERIYAHARALMIRKLWSMQPPLASNEIDDNIRNFNTAVDQVEREQAYGRGRVEASPRYNWANGDGRPVPTRPGTAPPQPQPPSRPASQRPAPPPAAPQARPPQHVPPPPSAMVTPMPPRNPAPAQRPAAQRPPAQRPPAPTQAQQMGPVVAQPQFQPQSQPQTRPQPNFQAPEPIAVGGRNDVRAQPPEVAADKVVDLHRREQGVTQ